MDSLKKLLNASWKREGEIFMPAKMTKISVMEVSAAVYLTHTEIFGREYTHDQLKNALSKLSVEDCLMSISKILTVLENDGYFNRQVQAGLVKELFEPTLTSKILKYVQGYFVFFELQLLVLAKYSVLYSKREPANDFYGKTLFPVFMRCLLGITDLLLEDKETIDEAGLQSEAIRSLYFNAHENMLHAIGRVEELFIQLPQKFKKHHQYLDLNKLFKKATGFSVQDHLILGFSLWAMLTQQTAKSGKFQSEYWLIGKEKHFMSSAVPADQIENLFTEFSIDVPGLFAELKKQDKKGFEYNFKGIKHHPLITFDNKRFFPMSFRFLKEKTTVDIYWILFDYIKENLGDKELHRYTNFTGILFEKYVNNLLSRVYPDSPVLVKRLIPEFEYKVKKVLYKTTDNIIICPTSLIVLETKISQLKVYRTGILGELSAFREDVQKIIVEGLKQIDRTVQHFKDGHLTHVIGVAPDKIKKFYPVIVSYGDFSIFPTLWKIIEEEVAKEPTIDKSLLEDLQVIDIDELETIEALIALTDMTLEELLRNKNNNRVFKRLPFTNYIFYEFSKFGRMRNPYLDKKYNEFTSKVTWKLFKKKRDYSKRNH